MIKMMNKDISASALMNAVKSGNEKEIEKAMEEFHYAICLA